MTLVDQSLCVLDGISHESEIAFRRDGFLTWDMLANDADDVFSPKKACKVKSCAEVLHRASRLGMVDVLVNHLPTGHKVRALHDMVDDALFFDIETDGMGCGAGITTISSLYRGEVRSFVRGENLSEFLDYWAKAKLVVSFNGKCFDVPIVMKHFGISVVPAQVDLMFESRHYGYRGGLKEVEKQTGFKRSDSEGMRGDDAIALWREWSLNGDRSALDLLIAYNVEDVLSLEHLYKVILKHSLENTGIDL